MRARKTPHLHDLEAQIAKPIQQSEERRLVGVVAVQNGAGMLHGSADCTQLDQFTLRDYACHPDFEGRPSHRYFLSGRACRSPMCIVGFREHQSVIPPG